MKERLQSIILGAVGAFGSGTTLGMITDLVIALAIAFLGGVLGFFGNLIGKKIYQKIKGNEKRD